MTPYTLNLLDLTLALYAVRHGGVELNPLMQSIPVMVAWKVLGVGALCLLLSKLATNLQVARYGLQICTAIYILANLWHIVNLIKIGVI